MNNYSKILTQGDSQPASQAMLHAIGLTKEDFKKPFVGIASTGYEGNPCNMHLNDLAAQVWEGVAAAGMVVLPFLFYPVAMVLWLTVDVLFRPVTALELE